MSSKFTFVEPQARQGNKIGHPSHVPPEEMRAFTTGISWRDVGSIPFDCTCPHVPLHGRMHLKHVHKACPVHWYL